MSAVLDVLLQKLAGLLRGKEADDSRQRFRSGLRELIEDGLGSLEVNLGRLDLGLDRLDVSLGHLEVSIRRQVRLPYMDPLRIGLKYG